MRMCIPFFTFRQDVGRHVLPRSVSPASAVRICAPLPFLLVWWVLSPLTLYMPRPPKATIAHAKRGGLLPHATHATIAGRSGIHMNIFSKNGAFLMHLKVLVTAAAALFPGSSATAAASPTSPTVQTAPASILSAAKYPYTYVHQAKSRARAALTTSWPRTGPRVA